MLSIFEEAAPKMPYYHVTLRAPPRISHHRAILWHSTGSLSSFYLAFKAFQKLANVEIPNLSTFACSSVGQGFLIA
jgi:hypothetical protein